MKSLTMNDCRSKAGPCVTIYIDNQPNILFLRERDIVLLDFVLSGDLMGAMAGGMDNPFIYEANLNLDLNEAIGLAFGLEALRSLPEVREAFKRIREEQGEFSAFPQGPVGDDGFEGTDAEWEAAQREFGADRWRKWNAILLRTAGAKFYENLRVSEEYKADNEKLARRIIAEMERQAAYFPFIGADMGASSLSYSDQTWNKVTEAAQRTQAQCDAIHSALNVIKQ